MKYHVITPFSRMENLRKQIEMLRPMGIEWNPIFNDDLPFRITFKDEWITPCWFPAPSGPFWQVWRHAMNWYVSTISMELDDYYLILNDDDFYEPGFFNKLRQHKSDVIIVSMKRGNRTPSVVIPERAHAPTELLACRENIRVGGVGAEQMAVKGRILKVHTWPDNISADGMVIEYIAANHPVEFVTDAYVWFNYLEPGRWD